MATTVLEESLFSTAMRDRAIVRSRTATWRWRIAPRTVRWSVVNAMFLFLYGFGLLLEPSSFHGPVFTVARRMMPLEGWAALMVSVAWLYGLVALTRRVYLYVLVQACSITLSVAWLIALLMSKYLEGATLTLGGVALWLFYIVTNISASQLPHQAEPTACKK